MTEHNAENDARPRCPGCGHSCCPYPGLECGGESDTVRACRVTPTAEKDAVGREEIRDLGGCPPEENEKGGDE